MKSSPPPSPSAGPQPQYSPYRQADQRYPIASHLISSHLISAQLSSAQLSSSHLISSHLISSHLISSHLICYYIRYKKTTGLIEEIEVDPHFLPGSSVSLERYSEEVAAPTANVAFVFPDVQSSTKVKRE